MKSYLILFYLLLWSSLGIAQPHTTHRFHFDEGENSPGVKFVGISKTDDRFGNPNSAVYLHGDEFSYVNLGTGNELKPANGSISLWFKIDNRVYSGSGYEVNPIILTKNQKGDDFFEGYYIGYELSVDKLDFASTFSEQKQVSIHSTKEVSLRTWHHVVLTYDSKCLTAYLDGEKEISVGKDFTTRFLQGDSVMLGNSANTKNKRYFNGAIDDIEIYNYVLSEQEVSELYNAPNPNRFKRILYGIYIVLGITGVVVLVVFLSVRQYKNALEKEKSKNMQRIKEFDNEIKVLKSQMNPHFIFNSFNTLQGFILKNDSDTALLYLNKFSKLLRKIMEGNTREYITIEEEVEILRFYIEIESMRFENELMYEIVIDEKIDVLSHAIPHFFIQPFVENAIWHGLLLKEHNKRLTIEFIYESEAIVVCCIEDNGIGRSLSRENEKNKIKDSLAIHLIRQRLQLMSLKGSEEYHLEIIDKFDDKNESAGTKVVLTIPLIKNDKSSNNR